MITGHLDEMCDAIHDVVRAARDPRPDEAEIVGVHVEGPFLNRAKRGAHAEQLLRQPSVEDARRLVDAADGMLRCVRSPPSWTARMRRSAISAAKASW